MEEKQQAASRFAVIGLGSFGYSLAVELYRQGADVVAIDKSDKLVDDISNSVTSAISFDCTDESLVRAHGLGEMDLVVVAVGEDFGANVLITRMLKDMGVRVHSRATTERERRILGSVGADKVYTPEQTQGEQEARSLTLRGVENYVSLIGGIDFVHVSPKQSMIGKTLRDMDIRRIYGLNVAYIGRLTAEGRRIYRIPLPDDEIQAGDHLFMMGTKEDIEAYISAEV